MTDGDDKLTRRYRELPADEPPAALDAAIRDAAHRAVAPKRNAQRWAVPVSLAAVLVLAVGVTLRMQQEQPGIEVAPPPNEYSMPSTAADSVAPKAEPAPPAKALAEPPLQKLKKDQPAAKEADDPRASRRDAVTTAQAPVLEEKRAFADQAERNVASPAMPAAPAAAPASAPPPVAAASPVTPPAPAALARERQEGQAAPALRMQAAPQAKTEAARTAAGSMDQARDPRERELERIATLRRENKHTEADEALAKFRKDNPDYRIPDAIWEQVKPR